MTILVDLEMQLSINKLRLCKSIDLGVMCEKLPDTAPIRLFIARRVAVHWQKGVPDKEQLVDYPKEFITDVLHAVLTVSRDTLLAKGLGSALSSPCNYHEHKTDQERTESKSTKQPMVHSTSASCERA